MPPTQKDGACLVHLVTDGDDILPGLAEIALQRLADLVRDVDTRLSHSANRQRSHLRGLRSRTMDLEAVTVTGAQPALRHLAPGGIVGTQEQDAPHLHGFAPHQAIGPMPGRRPCHPTCLAKCPHKLPVRRAELRSASRPLVKRAVRNLVRIGLPLYE